MSLQNDFYNMIKNTKTEKTTAFDTSAEVVRVEDNTIWVHIPGGIDETPIEKTVNAKAGDVVKVRVANGRAWITGNSTAPPTDDTVAIDAKETATVADKKAVVAIEKAEDSEKVASDALDIANATGQYFWHDTNGAHISTESNEPDGERNSLWNSLGMLFRRGANYLLAILGGGADGTGEKGLAVYDGTGNVDDNIVAKFTDKGSQIGKEKEAHSVIDKQSMRVIGANSDNDVTPVSYIGLLNGRATGYASLIEYPTVKVSSGADLSSVQVDLSHIVKEVSYCQTLILGEQVDLLSRTSFTDGNSFITLNLSGIGVTAGVSYMIFINYLTADLIPCYSFSNKDVAMVGSLYSGAYSMMIGQDVSASGYGAFAQGWNSFASVPYAFASGVDNDVNGEGATARGRCLKINNKGGTDQTVIGHYNSPVEDKAFVIGNGTANDSRSNAFEVDWNGNVEADGDVTDGSGNVLSEKANTASLSAVATSGSYNDLSNKPTLSGSHTTAYTSKFTIGPLTIVTGNVVVNVTSANTNIDKPVSFGVTFSNVPNIQVTMLNIGGSYYQKVTAAGPSTTGFNARVRAGGTPGNVNVNWMAVGKV